MSDYIDPEFCKMCREPESLCCCDEFCGSYKDAISRLKSQLADRDARLAVLADAGNWFHTSTEDGGPHTAWRGPSEPDDIADVDSVLDLTTALSLAGWEIVNTGKAGSRTWHSIQMKEADDE